MINSEHYEASKHQQEALQDKNYKKDLDNLSKDQTPVEDSVSLQHVKSMKDLMSNKHYTDAAKKSLDKYNLNADVIQIAHALMTTPLLSDNFYHKNYLTAVKGKGVSASGIAFYPDYVKAKDNTKLASKSEYVKDNEKVMHYFTMPVDTPELNRAKESAKNASDLLYKKQRKETIDNYRGFQTMDSKDHPIVQQGIKAADLISERKYKEDYMEDRNLIYYPVHLTPGYESAVKASQYINGPSYQKAYKQLRNDIHYDLTKTEQYQNLKDLDKLADNSYKTDPSTILFTQVNDGPDMERARAVKPLVSYWFYKDQAKKMLDKYHIDTSDQRVIHALHTNHLYSDKEYRDKYEKDIKGKLSAENIDAYPEYKHAMQVAKNSSQNEYVKNSAKELNNYTIPVDMPSIVHARKVDGLISDLTYGKSRQETIESFRGFQTMDSKCHPVVQRGIKAAELTSERKYKEDYMTDRNIIYYPVHLTAGYEAAVKSSKFASDADYKKWYKKNIRGCGNFPVNLTAAYEQAQQIKPYQSDKLYKDKYEQTKSEFSVVPDMNEMRNLKIVQPWLSKKKYKKEAHDLMGKYHLDAGVPEIAHALFVSNLFSAPKYKEEFEKEVKGYGADNLDKSPYFEQLLKASKLASRSQYKKKSDEEMQQYTLGIETSEIQQAMSADKLTSNIQYKKGANDALSSCQAYYKMNCDDIPSYKKHKNAAINASDIKYKEDYNDMKKFVYFPYHITPEYEKKLEASKIFSAESYMKDYKANRGKQNFKYHEIPAYISNKELQELLSVHKLKKELEDLHMHGFKPAKTDFQSEHVKEVQKRLSSNLYKAAAREVMDKYNITAELPEIKQALTASKLISLNLYKEDFNKVKGQGMKYDPEIPSFQHARSIKTLASKKLYRDDATQALHQYQFIADAPDITQAKKAVQNASEIEYKKEGKEKLSKVRGYQYLKASEQRDVAHARKINDIISPAKYKEEYNELRNIIYFPVHLTDGYETAIKANKFASPASYKKAWLQNRFKNNYKVHETEGYQLDRAVQQKISNIGYRAEYNRSIGKCPYITETPQRAHQRDMKALVSDKLYKRGARDIMDQYNLITDEPRMVTAIQAMTQISDNKYKEEYEKEKGKGAENIHETPHMKHILEVNKLISDKPYKQEALKELQRVTLPEDTTSIVHAKEVGKLASDVTYKKDAKDNKLQGYNRLPMKDNYVLKHLDNIKDLPSETQYKRDFYEQKGQLIPVADTPENVRLQKQQKLQSDNIYRKDLEKHIKGHGLSTDVTPQIQHAKDMSCLQSETKYKEGTKDQHEWKSAEAINTPTAVKAKETTDLTSDVKYKEQYEKTKGQGCNIITPSISHANELSRLVSDNTYKEKHREDSFIPAAFTVLSTTPQIKHVQDVGQKISELKYKEQHQQEDIGQSSELKDSLQLQQDKLTSELQSNIEYKKQGEREASLHKAYFACLNDTPQSHHAKKIKDILSDYKYKEAYENEKGIFYYPYFLTPQYETQVNAGKLQSQINYTKKAEKERHSFVLSTDQPNFKHAKVASELSSDIKYRQPHQGKAAKFREACDVPSILHSKKMQELLSDKKYRSNYEEIKDKYHLDVATPTFINAKRATEQLSDATYKEEFNKEKGQGFYSYKDSLQMNHLRTLPDKLSDNKYRQDLILSKGKVIQVSDTPWLASHKRAQKFISHIKYGQESGRKLKCTFQPDKFNKHVKNVTDNISESKYHGDYETYYRGNLIPLPVTPETRQVMKNSELLSGSAYKQKAKEGMKHYVIIPDDPEFKRLKDVATYLSDIAYKEDATKQQTQYTPVSDTPFMKMAKETQEYQSEVAYKGDSKKKLATEYTLPAEGTTVMQQQQYASTLASENTYKGKGEQVKHDPTAFKSMKETRDMKHAKKIAPSISEISYKSDAKNKLHHIHPVSEDPWMQKAKEANLQISDINYKAKDKDLAHNYKLGKTDKFINHAMKVRNNISDIKYKEDYIDNIGLCWCLPDERIFQHARKVADLSSDNKYKEDAKKMKGKYHITTDTPEFERFRKVQDDVSDNKYKEGVPEKLKDFTILEITPEIKHATNVSSLVSKIKYKAAYDISKGKYTVLEKDPTVEHAQNVNKLQSKSAYEKDHKRMKKDGYTLLADRPDTEHSKQVQRNVSNVEYKREARDNIDKDFTVLENTPDVQHAINTAKMQSDVRYKQKLEGKDIEMMSTPSMKHVIGANKLQSDLEYRKEFDKEIKGKGWKFIKDTPAQKHAEQIGNVQSQYKYTKKHRDNVGKGFTTITDRPDILHATSCKDMVSDYEYKRRHRDMAGKGYTFIPDNPSQMHAEGVTNTQSELQYRRKFGNKGKSWQVEDSPAMGHFMDAQKLVDNIDYKKSAKEINARGSSAAMEHTPSSLHYKKAQQILNDRRYKADYEKTVKGRGMTFDLHGTPAMDYIKRAEDIKSNKLYKEHYETNVKGKPALGMDAPHIINAQKANDLISDVKYKQNYRENKGRVYSMMDTPEMIRVRETQKAVSQVNYKADAELMKGRQSSLIDTPELRRVRQNTHNFSNIKYKDTTAKGRSVAILDTPELRTARQNAKNFSQIKYQEDRANMRGKATQVVDDLNLRRVKQATLISSDFTYKGLKNKTQEMEMKRSEVDNQQGNLSSKTNISVKLPTSPVMPPQATHEVVRSEPVRRWRRNPGSIFDYDPSEYETDTEYEQGIPKSSVGNKTVKTTGMNDQTDDEDFQRFVSWDSKSVRSQAVPWTDYVSGTAYRHVGAPSSVLDYDSTKMQQLTMTGNVGHKKQFKAVYDYEGADDDEITFNDGDVIINAQPIDEGWMFGTCLRTGQTGMLPANYVELVA